MALIAGTGGLPPVLADALVAIGKTPVICEMRGFPSEVEGDFERVAFRIETLATFLKTLQTMGVTQVCMAGAVERPIVDPTAIDTATLPMVPRLKAAMAKGDDGTLREIITIFEEHGFEVVGAHDVAPHLLPAAGVHTVARPDGLSQILATGQAALKEMGQADLGQAVVIRDGQVIAREAASGTAAMLDGLCGTSMSQKKAFLFKAPKPNQNLLADMPTIGLDTATQAAAAGLAGIVMPHGGVMVLDLPEVVGMLDAHGMFLMVTP